MAEIVRSTFKQRRLYSVAAVVLFLDIGTLYVAPMIKEDAGLFLAILIPAFLILLSLVAATLIVTVKISDEGLMHGGPFRRNRFYKWDELEGYMTKRNYHESYVAPNQSEYEHNLLLRTKAGKVIYISDYLIANIGVLLNAIQEYLDPILDSREKEQS